MAAPIPVAGASAEIAALQGIAACFLPLPVVTGLPVHVNGYFELSSNRRDIWFGSDMAGAGKLRSQWNVCLLTEVRVMSHVVPRGLEGYRTIESLKLIT